MKYANGKRNRPLTIAVLLYGVMLLDIMINTAIAHITNNGISRISDAIMVGPLVVNPISVLSAFVIGTVLILIGLITKQAFRSN